MSISLFWSLYTVLSLPRLVTKIIHWTKNEVYIKYFFSKCDQIHSFLQMWSHLLKKSLLENFRFCAVIVSFGTNVNIMQKRINWFALHINCLFFFYRLGTSILNRFNDDLIKTAFWVVTQLAIVCSNSTAKRTNSYTDCF